MEQFEIVPKRNDPHEGTPETETSLELSAVLGCGLHREPVLSQLSLRQAPPTQPRLSAAGTAGLVLQIKVHLLRSDLWFSGRFPITDSFTGVDFQSLTLVAWVRLIISAALNNPVKCTF